MKGDNDFILNILAHEMRGPLNTIGGLAALLEKEIPPHIQTENIKAYLDGIFKTCQETGVLLEELLYFASIEDSESSITLNEEYVAELLEECVSASEPAAKIKNIRLQLRMPPLLAPAQIDKTTFKMAVNNLLSNAIKFSFTGGTVCLSAKNTPEGKLTVTVEDSGIGIPVELHPHLFKKFTKAKRPGTNGEKPHGLGLAIVKSVIEAHHGNIWFDSAPGIGTRFSFTI